MERGQMDRMKEEKEEERNERNEGGRNGGEEGRKKKEIPVGSQVLELQKENIANFGVSSYLLRKSLTNENLLSAKRSYSVNSVSFKPGT